MFTKSYKHILAGIITTLTIAGCASTGSVKRAQSTADHALTQAQDGSTAAQRAQSGADSAMSAAQKAQTSADGASSSVQGAVTDAKSANDHAGRLEARMKHFEARLSRNEHRLQQYRWKQHHVYKHTGHKHRWHRHPRAGS